jgi:hypothetical protein
MALSMLVVIAAMSVLGYSMQNTHQPLRASGNGGDPCISTAGSIPACHFTGFSTGAYYSTADRTTCASGVFTGYSVSAMGYVTTKPSDAIASGPVVYVSYQTFDTCSWARTSYWAAIPEAIKTTGNLDSANLQTTVQLHDWSNNPGPTVTVDLTWNGFGPLSTTVQDVSYRTGDTVFKSHFTGSDRMAMVTGTISDGTTTMNVDMTSMMYDSKGGTISIEHA